MSTEHKAKIGAAHKGKIVSEKTKNRMRHAHLGKKLTKSHRMAISKSKMGRISGMKGKKHSQDTKSKISNALIGEKNPFFGKTHSLKTRLAVAASNRRRAKNARKSS